MASRKDFVFPQPYDDDDDDVVWALQAGNSEWLRGGNTDALVWLRRAIDSANAAGNAFRAGEIQAAADVLTEVMWQEAPASEQAPEAATIAPSDVEDADEVDIEDVSGERQEVKVDEDTADDVNLGLDDRDLEEIGDDDLIAEEAWLDDEETGPARAAETAPVTDESASVDDLTGEIDLSKAQLGFLLDQEPAEDEAGEEGDADAEEEAEEDAEAEPEAEEEVDEETPGPRQSDADIDDDLAEESPEEFDRDEEGSDDLLAGEISGGSDEEPLSGNLAAGEIADDLLSLPNGVGEEIFEDAEAGAASDDFAEEEPAESEELPRFANEDVDGMDDRGRSASTDDAADLNSLSDEPLADDDALDEALTQAPPGELEDPAPLAPEPSPGLEALVTSLSAPDTDLGVEPIDEAIAVGLESETPRVSVRPPASQMRASAPGTVDGVPLAECLGFEDLPEDSLAALASMAQLTRLAVDEELTDFGAALVTHGAVSVVTEISDEPALIATKGDVVFTEGSLADGTKLRVVCTGANTVLATWTKSQLKEALKDSPWVRDALRQLADRFQALAGTTLGILGEKLDAALRRSVTDRMEVRSYAPGELVITKGVGMPGLFIVCAGRVEIDSPQASADHYLSGDFLFPEAVLAAAPTPATARAGAKGALLLFAGKHIVHELVTSVPVLLEALVS